MTMTGNTFNPVVGDRLEKADGRVLTVVNIPHGCRYVEFEIRHPDGTAVRDGVSLDKWRHLAPATIRNGAVFVPNPQISRDGGKEEA